MVHVNSTYDQAAMNEFARPLVAQTQLARSIAHDIACADSAYLYTCIQSFPPCVLVNTSSGEIALPLQACEEVCINLNSNCSALYEASGQPPVNCTPAPVYDLSALGGPSSFSACEDAANFSTTVAASNDACPLGKIVFGKTKWRALVILLAVMNWVGFASSAVVVLLYLTNPSLRRFPGWVIAGTGVCCFILTIFFGMNQWWGVDELQCSPKRETACAAQAVGATFFGIAAASFWMVMSIVSCVCLYSPHPPATMDTLRRYQWWSLTVLILPAIATFGGWAYDDLGPGHVLPVCGLKSASASLYWPVAVTLFVVAIGSTAWVASMVVVLRTTVLGKSRSRDFSMHAAMILYELIALVFAGGYALTFLGVYYSHNLNEFQDEITAYFTGTRSTFPSLPYGAFVCIVFCISAVVPSWAIIFGLRRAHLVFVGDLWRGIWQSLFGGKSSSLRATPTTSNNSGSSPRASVTSEPMEPGVAKLAKFMSSRIFRGTNTPDPYLSQNSDPWEFDDSGKRSEASGSTF